MPAPGRNTYLGKPLYLCKNHPELRSEPTPGLLALWKSGTDVVAVQYYVTSGCGIPLRKAYLVHIDNTYVRQGEIVPQELFATQDVTDVDKDMLGSIPEELAIMRKMLWGKGPDIDIGPHCSEPFECDFTDHCWQPIPKDSIFTLKGGFLTQRLDQRRGAGKFTSKASRMTPCRRSTSR